MPISKARLFASVLTRDGDVVTLKTANAGTPDLSSIDSAYIQAREAKEITRKTQTIADSAETTIDTFSGSSIRTAKYIVSAQTAGDSQHQTQEILVSHDDSTATMVAYATLLHGTATIVTYDAEYNSGTISLKADPQGFAGLKFGVERTTLETV